jgi:pyruvate dehydrogenase E1 component alpha subunit
MGAHTTSDDPTRYRLASDLEAWKLKDPLERMKSFLYKQQMVDASYFEALQAESDALAARLREGCLSMPDPQPLELFDEVYAEDHPLIDEQRALTAAYLESFEPLADAGQER